MNLFPRPARRLREKLPPEAPEVTAIVTLFNYARFVEQCLDSLREQTLRKLEIVIVDDASTDNGVEVATRWLEKNEQAIFAYQLVSHGENMGLSYARNTAFEYARADIVFVMDADNALYPAAIERCLSAMRTSKAAGAYTQLELFGEFEGVGDADFWSIDRLKRKNYIDAMALVAKSVWRDVGGYSQLNAAGWEDYDFWCKLVEHNLSMTFVPEMLCRYRIHEASMSRNQTNPATDALVLDMSLRHPWLEI